MIRAFVTIVSALALMLGLAPAAGAATGPPFCAGVKPCVVGGDAGATWVLASASSPSKARKVAARLLRNAKAVHRQYGAPQWIDLRVIRKGACWRRYGSGKVEASRACTYKHVERKLS